MYHLIVNNLEIRIGSGRYVTHHLILYNNIYKHARNRQLTYGSFFLMGKVWENVNQPPPLTNVVFRLKYKYVCIKKWR